MLCTFFSSNDGKWKLAVSWPGTWAQLLVIISTCAIATCLYMEYSTFLTSIRESSDMIELYCQSSMYCYGQQLYLGPHGLLWWNLNRKRPSLKYIHGQSELLTFTIIDLSFRISVGQRTMKGTITVCSFWLYLLFLITYWHCKVLVLDLAPPKYSNFSDEKDKVSVRICPCKTSHQWSYQMFWPPTDPPIRYLMASG